MISFVLLNYNNISDTIECIESINRIKTKEKISIIVVDNNTMTKKEVALIKKYTNDIILLYYNIGFAKANNIGCDYAIKKYKPDFLIVSNNDIIVMDNDIINKIKKNYKENKFDMLGPKIITDNGESVNPFPVFKNKKEIINDIRKSKKLIIIYSSKLLNYLLIKYIKIKRKIIKVKPPINGNKKKFNVALHGCFIIFSKKYYKRFENVFFNDTFLYHEEEFLYQRKLAYNLVTVYDPEINVFHKEGASLNYSFGKEDRKKNIFKQHEKIKSLKLLLNYMEKINEK